jgi:hypothetical protein
MKDVSSESKSTPVERVFKDLMQHGDDFYKIELWRPAKKWYKKALELNIEPEKVSQKISECDRLLAFEVKVIWILAAIAAGFVLACLIF